MVAQYLGFTVNTMRVVVLLLGVVLAGIALVRGADPSIVVVSMLGSLWIVNASEKVHGR